MWYNSFGKVVTVIILCFGLLLLITFGLLIFAQYRNLAVVENTTPTNQNVAVLNYLAPDADDDPYLGNVNAPIEIIAFEDFQCPFCQQSQPILQSILQRYPADVKLVFRDFPLYTIHPQSIAASQAGECADEQGKFWPWHDLVFLNQAKLAQAPAIFSVWAEQADMNVSDFAQCVTEERYANEVQKDLNEGFLAGVSVTPTFFVNGQKYEGVLSEDQWIELIEAVILQS